MQSIDLCATLHGIVIYSTIDGYYHYMSAAVGIISIEEFDSIRVRRFLTLNASAPTDNTEDILYRLIYKMVSKTAVEIKL